MRGIHKGVTGFGAASCQQAGWSVQFWEYSIIRARNRALHNPYSVCEKSAEGVLGMGLGYAELPHRVVALHRTSKELSCELVAVGDAPPELGANKGSMLCVTTSSPTASPISLAAGLGTRGRDRRTSSVHGRTWHWEQAFRLAN
jgi:hypothetical protein